MSDLIRKVAKALYMKWIENNATHEDRHEYPDFDALTYLEHQNLLNQARAAVRVSLEEAAKIVERRGKQIKTIGTTPGNRRLLEWTVSGYKDAARCIRHVGDQETK